MTNKELIDILHNIPQEVFQSKNHKKLSLVFHRESPRLTLYAFKDHAVIEITLYDSMTYSIWNNKGFTDIRNQVESYLDILGFTEWTSQTLYTSAARYTPKIGVAISSTMTDTEIMKLMRHEIANQMFDSLQKKE